MALPRAVDGERVLEEYRQLTEAVRRGRQAGRGRAADPWLLTPKPITLERSHLAPLGPDSYGAHRVWHGYAVAAKAEGERALLYVGRDGQAFLLSHPLQVADPGLRAADAALPGTLLDGELIAAAHRADGADRPLFAAFDVYFCAAKPLVDLPLFGGHPGQPSRYAALQAACAPERWVGGGALDLCCKVHIPAEGEVAMHTACQHLLEEIADQPYRTDGLIFTPVALGVLGYYPGRATAIGSSMRWDRLLKWKPAHLNSIDFLVEKGQSRFDPETRQFLHEWILFTGYSPSYYQPIDVLEGVRLRYDSSAAEQRRRRGAVYERLRFRPAQFWEPGVDTAWIAVQRAQSFAEDGSVIEPHSIVEFTYRPDPTVPPPRRWVALRVRADKTRRLRERGSPGGAANDLRVATSVWRTMHLPVTAEMLTGCAPLPPPPEPEDTALDSEGQYYAREVPRDNLALVHMLNFHNHGVKKMLYEWDRDREALLELACGRAADLRRWRDAQWRFVFGVDLVRDNVSNPRDGAYARMLRLEKSVPALSHQAKGPVELDHLFAVGDCAKPLDTGAAADGLDDPSVGLLGFLYGSGRENPSFPSQVGRLHGKAAGGFNAVACMFAVQYFFRDEASLGGLLHNVATNLRPKGVFVATFMDGERVDALLGSAPEGRVEGRCATGDTVLWALVKRYDVWGVGADAYGKVVDVYLENINRLIPEYLVRITTLVDKARGFGLEQAIFWLWARSLIPLAGLAFKVSAGNNVGYFVPPQLSPPSVLPSLSPQKRHLLSGMHQAQLMVGKSHACFFPHCFSLAAEEICPHILCVWFALLASPMHGISSRPLTERCSVQAACSLPRVPDRRSVSELEASELFSATHEALLQAVPTDASKRTLLDEDRTSFFPHWAEPV